MMYPISILSLSFQGEKGSVRLGDRHYSRKLAVVFMLPPLGCMICEAKVPHVTMLVQKVTCCLQAFVPSLARSQLVCTRFYRPVGRQFLEVMLPSPIKPLSISPLEDVMAPYSFVPLSVTVLIPIVNTHCPHACPVPPL